MTKSVKTVMFSILTLVLLLIGAVVITNILVKNKVENYLLNRLPKHITQDHKSIALNTLRGTITVKGLSVSITNRNDTTVHTKVSAERLIVENISYWDYLVHSEIHIEDIKIKSPVISYHTQKLIKNQDSTSSSGLLKLYKPILVEALSIENATFYMYDDTKDSLVLLVENSTVNIRDIKIDKDIINRRFPVEFKNYRANADSIFVKTNPYENLTVADFNLENKQAVFNNVTLKTKYARTELSQQISTERDHFDLEVEKISVDNIKFGFDNRALYVSSDYIIMESPVLKIFRDKLVNDDLTTKKLYSQALRELPFQLTIDSVVVNNASIGYTEKVKQDNDGGTINLDKLNASIINVSNTYMSPNRTALKIEGFFMKNTPFKSRWNFDINKPSDDFIFSMEIGELQAERLNAFTEPNLKVRLNGQTDKIYYTIDGNKNKSSVDLKVKYEDFEVVVLNKEGNKKNWLLSTVANLFVAKDSEDKNDNFREATVVVERDKTKSVFNFIWLNLSKGLLKSIAGNGEK